jgi:hypothetical protein
MRKLILLSLLALSFSAPVFADDASVPPDEATSPDCEMISKACLDAGYTRADNNPGKMFWHDCMKPILFGKQVSGVSVDAKVVTSCRQFKIKNLKEQLDEFKKMKN